MKDDQIQAYNRLTGVKAILRELLLCDIPSEGYYVNLMDALKMAGEARRSIGWDPYPEENEAACKVLSQ